MSAFLMASSIEMRGSKTMTSNLMLQRSGVALAVLCKQEELQTSTLGCEKTSTCITYFVLVVHSIPGALYLQVLKGKFYLQQPSTVLSILVISVLVVAFPHVYDMDASRGSCFFLLRPWFELESNPTEHGSSQSHQWMKFSPCISTVSPIYILMYYKENRISRRYPTNSMFNFEFLFTGSYCLWGTSDLWVSKSTHSRC